MKLAYLNLLWIGFSLAGGIIIGIMPATLALFAVIRKWLMGEKEIPIFQTFWHSYKSDFVTINMIGLVFVLVGFILAIDIYFFSTMHSLLSKSFLILFSILGFFYFITFLYLFPTFVHFELKGFQYVKYAMILGISNIIGTIVMVLGFVAISFVFIKLPATIIFFGMSILAVIIMWPAYRGFIRINNQSREQVDIVKTSK